MANTVIDGIRPSTFAHTIALWGARNSTVRERASVPAVSESVATLVVMHVATGPLHSLSSGALVTESSGNKLIGVYRRPRQREG